MLFRSRDLEAIFSGTVTTAFRRWKKPTVRVGGTVRTARGLVGIDAIEVIDPATLTEADAAAANYPSLGQLIGMFDSQEGTCYRIRLHPAGPDPRDALRDNDQLTDADREQLAARVRKVEKAAETLALIADHPSVVSTELA